MTGRASTASSPPTARTAPAIDTSARPHSDTPSTRSFMGNAPGRSAESRAHGSDVQRSGAGLPSGAVRESSEQTSCSAILPSCRHETASPRARPNSRVRVHAGSGAPGHTLGGTQVCMCSSAHAPLQRARYTFSICSDASAASSSFATLPSRASTFSSCSLFCRCLCARAPAARNAPTAAATPVTDSTAARRLRRGLTARAEVGACQPSRACRAASSASSWLIAGPSACCSCACAC
mmetsp:Transcript_9648/g.23946  ORF Transcript_9648/g.23946 Transcript_9648/m.23946 type:complete len:236 (-) Transcript_9648:357-1064(-)